MTDTALHELRRLAADMARLQFEAQAARAELVELRAFVAAALPVLSAADQNALNLLLPILPRGRLMLASEVVALVLVDAHGDLLRHHLADYLQRDTSRAIGKFLRRCCGRPVAGSYIECLGDSGRGGLLYLVREFGA